MANATGSLLKGSGSMPEAIGSMSEVNGSMPEATDSVSEATDSIRFVKIRTVDIGDNCVGVSSAPEWRARRASGGAGWVSRLVCGLGWDTGFMRFGLPYPVSKKIGS